MCFVVGLVESSFVGIVGLSYGSTWFRVADIPGLIQKSEAAGP